MIYILACSRDYGLFLIIFSSLTVFLATMSKHSCLQFCQEIYSSEQVNVKFCNDISCAVKCKVVMDLESDLMLNDCAQRCRSLNELGVTPKGHFLILENDEIASCYDYRCLNPLCQRGWTRNPYCLWKHYACASTECISYLHAEVARIQCELRSLDNELESNSLQMFRCDA